MSAQAFYMMCVRRHPMRAVGTLHDVRAQATYACVGILHDTCG